ncbi:MAG: sigma-70 family RNA polymerase sigma factor [Deltaproteobacteria bacterium]
MTDAHGEAPADREAFYRSHVGYVMTVLTRGFRYQRASGGLGFHRVEDPFEAEDLTQETFAAFFGQVEKGNYDPSRPALPYLRRIAVNLALGRARIQGREVALTEASEPVEAEPRDLEHKELQVLMTEFKEALDDRERAVLEQYAKHDVASQAEVGAELGMSRDQVYRTLVQIRRRASKYFSAKGWWP